MMFFHKKISSDVLLLVLLVVRLRLDSDIGLLNERTVREPESREVFLGSSSAYTQITFHSPYSSIQYPHPKSLEYSEQEEAAILFNRLNYFNSVRQRPSHLIAYYASSPGVRNADSAIETSNGEAATGGESTAGDASLPTMVEELEPATSATIQDLSPEDMDLIEILWKQDIDLGVSREAYDSRPCVEVEKLKDSKENLQDFFLPGDEKTSEESECTSNPFAGLNYTVDSETGEFVLDGLSEDNTQLLENSSFPALNCDSYLPISEDDDVQISDLSDVFPPSQFPDLAPENYSDSEYLLSQIQDIEKELESFIEKDLSDETLPEDVFPNIDDCWPDSTAMLPLLALGNSHQNPFVSLPPIHESAFRNANPVLPLSSNMPSRLNEDFTSILQSSSVEASATDEAFHPVPASLGPSSVGCALAESIATLHNDTDPIPTNNLLNAIYNPDLPELLYSNQSLAVPHNELLIHNIFADDDFQLVSMSSGGNQRNLSEDHIDTSSDTASLASGRVPSVSDCPDWIDSCSESSSHHGENRTYSFAPHTPRQNTFGHNQNTELHLSSMPKWHRNIENSDGNNPDFSRASFENSNTNDQYFSVKCEYHDSSENSAAISRNQLSYRKFDFASSRLPGAVDNNILHHNHSYHLPFSCNDSHYKPILRDKSRSSEDEDSCNKDEKKAKELNLPISIDDIINLAIEEYNERLSKYELTDQQLNLIRDIRRRGKNKVAAQNCRKRKMDQISSLQQDLDALQNEKMQLKSKQDHLLQEKHSIEDKYAQLCQIVSRYTNCKPPDTSRSQSVHNNEITLPTTPDILDDDSDLSRGARTKRKFKK